MMQEIIDYHIIYYMTVIMNYKILKL